MATTHIRIQCKKCGYTYKASRYGYVNDPLGIPLYKCPNCGVVSLNKTRKEWIQKSTIGKLFAIAPRLGLVLPLIISFILSAIISRNSSDASFLMIAWFILFFPCWYVVLCISVNRWSFYHRYVASIARTRNPQYLALLSKLGKTYDESIPSFLIFTKASKATVEDELEHTNIPENIEIPTFNNCFDNY